MSKLEIMLELERRGKLPDDRQALLNEARKRGLIPQLETSQEELVNPDITSPFGTLTAPPEKQPRDLTWGQVGKEALINTIPSALQMGDDIVGAITNPIQTAQGLGNIVAGAVDKITPIDLGKEQYADAVIDFFKERYGGIDNLKETIATDPVGFASDISSILTGGGALAKAGGLAKAGSAIGKVGRAIDPIRVAGKTAGGTGRLSGSLIQETLGRTTGAGREPIKRAVEAGRKGSQAFKENLRGASQAQSVVDDAKMALDTIREKRNLQYSQQIGKTINDPAILDVNPIIKKTLDMIDEQSVGGFSKVGKETANKVDEIVDIVGEFQSNPNIHNAMGFDALKRRLSDINIPIENRQAERIRSGLVNSVKDTITKQAPEYAKTMKDYSQASDLITEIERSLSLGRKPSVDTAMRKLQSVMRDNVQTNYGQRLDLVKQLESAGDANILDSLAGQALSSPMPRGLGGSSLGGMLGVGGVAINPSLLLTAPAFSPRVVGEGAYIGGRAKALLEAGKVTPANLRKLSETSFQAGRLTKDK